MGSGCLSSYRCERVVWGGGEHAPPRVQAARVPGISRTWAPDPVAHDIFDEIKEGLDALDPGWFQELNWYKDLSMHTQE